MKSHFFNGTVEKKHTHRMERSRTLAGFGKENEDAFYNGYGTEVNVHAVFDGHGYGKAVRFVELVKTTLDKHVRQHDTVTEEAHWKRILVDMFQDMHDTAKTALLTPETFLDPNGVVRNKDGTPVHTGSTATVCLFLKRSKTLLVANVGDSAAMLIGRDGTFRHLTVDHCPESKAEYDRIRSSHPNTSAVPIFDKLHVNDRFTCCDRIFTSEGEYQHYPHKWANERYPSNVRNDQATYFVSPGHHIDTICIAMTRALGNYHAAQYGITHQPSVNVFQVTAGDLLVVASDGIWDVVQFDSFSKRCTEVSLTDLFTELVTIADSHFPTTRDDMTLTVVDLCPTTFIEDHVQNHVKDRVEDHVKDRMQDHVQNRMQDRVEDRVEDRMEDGVQDHVARRP